MLSSLQKIDVHAHESCRRFHFSKLFKPCVQISKDSLHRTHFPGKMFSVKVCVNTVKGYCKNVTCFGDVKKQTITAKLKSIVFSLFATETILVCCIKLFSKPWWLYLQTELKMSKSLCDVFYCQFMLGQTLPEWEI